MSKQKNRGGRPRKSSGEKQDGYLDVRLRAAEKQAFREAAELAGLSLAAWVRDRLRIASRRELLEFGRKVPFIQQVEN
jgi:hypothetical protein